MSYKPLSFSFRVHSSAPDKRIPDKDLFELMVEQNPDVPEETLKAALGNMTLKVYKALLRTEYERLKAQSPDKMSDADREKWAFIVVIFHDEIVAESNRRFSKWKSEVDAQEKEEQAVKRLVAREIAIAEAYSEPLFTLNLPNEYLIALAEAGFTSIGQIVFSIKASHQVVIDAYLAERDKARAKKIKAYLRLTKRPLSEIVGTTAYSLIGSRLLQHNYVSRDEFLSAFKGDAF